MEKLLLDVKEVASALGCGRTYVYGMIQRGELPVVKLGRLTRVEVSALDDFISRQGNASSVRPLGSVGMARWTRPFDVRPDRRRLGKT
ncbi:MAG: helix-turn-helix domain-containing protein [Candidatus Dormiibacterota bacterium]